MTQSVLAVSKSRTHSFKKNNSSKIQLIEGHGVKGDAHMGKTVQHRSRVAKDPTQPNLRQVHLIQAELFEELEEQGFKIKPGQMGENITTSGIDLLTLPKNTILKIGEEVEIRITGLRNPCTQLNDIKEGLLKALVYKEKDGTLVRKAGVMGTVRTGGIISPGDRIEVMMPNPPFEKLERV